MLRVLSLATLFPNSARPTLGVFVERQIRGLVASEGVEVEVVAPVGIPAWPLSLHPHYRPLRALPRVEEWKGLKVHRPLYPVRPFADQSGTADRIVAQLRPLLAEIRKRFPFDIIAAEYFWPDGPVAMQLAAQFGLPFSVKARGSDIHLWGHRPDTAALVAEAAQRADGLLAVSAGLRADMIALGMPGDRIRIHRTGVDLDLFRPIHRAKAKADLGVDGPLLVTVGGLIPRKGQEFAIKALQGLPQATLLVVGDGPDRKALERMSVNLGLGERVRFLGARPHQEIPALLAAADVMVLPTASEGLANVWVESLACGTPVVTTNIPGAEEAVDFECGRLVERSAEAIARAARELLAAPIAPGVIRRKAERFSWSRNSAELVDHLSGIVARCETPRAA